MAAFALLPAAGQCATCSRANLTRCLDSACAINISSNPAARCQYCGTSGAGTAPQSGAMRTVSIGASAKYSISDKELKSAPTEPGARYVWASTQCLAKVDGCTPDDIADTYDTLIEQSCRAAGINTQMSALQAQARQTKSRASCATDIRACIIADNKCTADFRECKENAAFDGFFATCSAQATGCDNYTSEIRKELISARDTAIKNADAMVNAIVQSYQNSRAKKLSDARATCTDNAGHDACIQTVCTNNMPNKCAGDSENAAATELCKFYKLACDTLK